MTHFRFIFWSVTCVVLGLGATAGAADFSGTPGTLTVGGSGSPDFPTLADAANNFNAQAAGINGAWTLAIQGSTTETVNVFFANTIASTGSLLIKPAANVQPIITFTDNTDPAAGPSHGGHLIFGAKGAAGGTQNATNPTTATINVTIDGDNGTAGDGTNRDLTFINSGVTYSNARVVAVVGDSTGFTIKNCVVTNTDLAGGNPYAIAIKRWGDGTNFHFPNNSTVDNCEVNSGYGSSSTAKGVATESGGGGSTGGIEGTIVKNCTINAAVDGVYLNVLKSAEVSGNTIKVFSTAAAGTVSCGIWHLGGASTDGGTISIHDNKVLQVENRAVTAGTVVTPAGVAGINIAFGTNNPPTNLTAYVYNNMVTGLQTGSTAAPTTADMMCAGIRANHASLAFNCYFNSVYLQNTNLGGTSHPKAFGLGQYNNVSNNGIDWRNNIVRVEEDGASCLYRDGTAASYTSNFNDLSVTNTGGGVGNLAGVVKTTLTDWQTASGGDANSKTINPFTADSPATGVWVSASDLHFTADPGANYNGTPVTTPISITTDIDGNTRNASTPTMGVDERVPGSAAVSDWMMY